MSVSKHYTPTLGYTHLIAPGESGIKNLHFGILNLSPNSTYFDHSDDCEVALIALEGECRLLVGHNGNKANGVLGKRKDVFDGEACLAFIPHRTTYEVITTSKRVEIAFCKTPSHTDSAAVILDAGENRTDTNYKLCICENEFETEWIGEGFCFYRFLEEKGTATVNMDDSKNKSTRVVMHHNDLLGIAEQTRARLLEFEGEIYELTVFQSIHLQ